MLHQSDLVCVKRVTGKGRGVFARRPIRKGTVIETVPVLLIPFEHIAVGRKDSFFARFCFLRTRTAAALALGYGALYNHSFRPNAQYDEGPAATMTFTALRAIAAGEEITINYNGSPADRRPVGFDVIENHVCDRQRPPRQ